MAPLEARGISPTRACARARDSDDDRSTSHVDEAAYCDLDLVSPAKMSYSDECSIRYRHGEKSVLRLLLLGAAGAIDARLEQLVTSESPPPSHKRSQTLRQLMGVAIRRMGRVVQVEPMSPSQSRRQEDPGFLEVKSLKCPAADARSKLASKKKSSNDRPTEPLLELSTGKMRQYVSAWLLQGETILDTRMQLVPWATRFGSLHGFHGSSRNLRILDRVTALARQRWAKLEGGKASFTPPNFKKLLSAVLDRVRHFAQEEAEGEDQAAVVPPHDDDALEPTPVLLKNPSFVVNVLPALGRHVVNPLSELFLQSSDLVDSEVRFPCCCCRAAP